jgi:predicted RNase H-like HicB family nuclease
MKARAKKRIVRHAEHRFTVIIEPDEPGYHVYCPILAGCHSCGNTIEKAMNNVRKAASLYCETLRADGKPLPEENYIITWVGVSI